jgi:hypothetical protein
MIRTAVLTAVVLFCAHHTLAKTDVKDCLPADVKATDVVSTVEVFSGGKREIRKTTAEQALKALKARCSQGKLIDESGKEIRFYRLVGCWGHPSPDDQEVLDRQRQELVDLKKRYRVIEVTCNPSGLRIP